MLLSKVAELAL